MATLATPIREREMLDDPACVKVVFDAAGRRCISAAVPFRTLASGATIC